MKRTLILAAAFLILSGGVAQAQLVVPLTGIQTFDGLGDPSNTVSNNDVSPDLFINGVVWTAVDGQTVGSSWGSEANINVDATSQPGGFNLQPFTQNAPCSPCGPVSGSADTVSNPTLFPFALDPDGNIRLEFFETYIDVSDSPSLTFTAGDVTFTTVIPVELMSFTVN